MRTPKRKKRFTQAQPLADLIGEALTPACRKRGSAAADLPMTWPDVVGARYAETTQPETLRWPRHDEDDYAPATLVVRCEGHVALLFQHDIPQVLERINRFLGWRAVDRIRVIQRPLVHRDKPKTPSIAPLSEEDEEALTIALTDIEAPRLREALQRLGRAAMNDDRHRR